MNSSEDKLTKLVADLQKAVIRLELHRGRDDRPVERKTRRRR